MAVGVYVYGSNAFPIDDNFAPLRRCLRPCPVRQTASDEHDTRQRASSLAQHFSEALRHLHFLPPTDILRTYRYAATIYGPIAPFRINLPSAVLRLSIPGGDPTFGHRRGPATNCSSPAIARRQCGSRRST